MITAPRQPKASIFRMRGRESLLTVTLLTFVLASAAMQAQTLTVLHRFDRHGDGRFPYDSLLRTSAGQLFGTTGGGGSFGYGTVFEVTPQGQERILHSFWGGDGRGPTGSLARDSAGNLYGTTGRAGRHGGGNVFKLSVAGKFTVLYAFSGGTDGGGPQFGLLRDHVGNLYGTTSYGGDLTCQFGLGCGVVFRIAPNGKETVLYAFTGGQDGVMPSGDLIRDQAGNLYGVTEFGGTSSDGIVFKVTPSGKETVLYTFSGGATGYSPMGRLATDDKGNVYGTTYGGGDPSCLCGVVFKIDPGGNETILHNFTGNPDGANPFSGLTRDQAGNLYGGTSLGGGGCPGIGIGCGSIFSVSGDGSEKVLYGFKGGTDGGTPLAAPILDNSGDLYGTAWQGGDSSCLPVRNGCGVAFKLTP
jgi:uncharacterized repeat protein (TIGR03803 family)